MDVGTHDVFITGGTGYIGGVLIPRLLERGNRVRALTREQSRHKIPPQCDLVIGDALNASTFADRVEGCDTFIQLVGVSHPSPAKAAQFESIDLASARASISAAAGAGVMHFIYISVAQPAPAMKAYQKIRARGEQMIRESGLTATILRPWYVLGPGHRWPYMLIPMYRLFEQIPSTRETARRLGLVTLEQMARAIVNAVEHPPEQSRIIGVPQIKNA